MTSILGKLFPDRRGAPVPTRGDVAYAAAMGESDDLLERMHQNSRSTDVARAVMADIWSQNHNIPFLTTVVETVQEMKAPIAQRPEDKSTRKSDPS